MAAPFKRTRTKNISEIANEVILALKKNLSAMRDDVNEIKLEVRVCGHGFRPFGNYFKDDYRDVSILVGRDKWDGLNDMDVSSLKYELNKHLGEFDNVETDGIFFNYGNFTADVEDFPTTFRMLGTPCKEFKELAKLVDKKYSIKLKPQDIYIVALFGKSGRYGESGKREYTAFNAARCSKIISEIKSFGRKKTTATIATLDDIDTDYSERYLTECYGTREKTIKVCLAEK